MTNQKGKQFLGRFFYKLTDNGNLIGEFSNSSSPRIYAESADRIEPNVDGKFPGEYYHTWYDDFDDNEPGGGYAKLTIERKPGSGNIYSLNWLHLDGRTPGGQIFWGEGMLCDGMLIGDYRNFETILPPVT